jgi:quinol monooxygenase YgiN
MTTSLASEAEVQMLAVTRFEVAEDDAASFLTEARAALTAFASREGYVRGRIGRSPDVPTAWVMTTEWVGVGAYRRGLSSYDVKVAATPLMARATDEPSAFEVVVTDG